MIKAFRRFVMNDSSSDDRSEDGKKHKKNVIEFPSAENRKAAEKQLRDSKKSDEKKASGRT